MSTCDQLESEIAELRAAIAAIPKVNQQDLLAQCRALIEQLTPGIATAIAVGLVNPVKVIAEGAATTAESALSLAGIAKAAADFLAPLRALVPYIGALLAIIPLLAELGTIQALGGRIDALEHEVDSLSAGLSQALGLLNGVRWIALQALSLAQQAQSLANQAIALANSAFRQIQSLQDVINYLTGKVNTHTSQIAALDGEWRQVEGDLQDLTTRIAGVDDEIHVVDTKAINAQDSADTAREEATRALSAASSAQATASTALTTAHAAQATATAASSKADIASGKADKAQATADAANTAVAQLKPQVVTLQNEVNTLNVTVNNINGSVTGLEYAFPPIAAGVSNLAGQISGINARLNQPAINPGYIGGFAAQTNGNSAAISQLQAQIKAVAQTDQTNLNNLISQIKDGVVTSPNSNIALPITIGTDVTKLQTDVSNIQGQLDQLGSQVTNNQQSATNAVDKLKSDIQNGVVTSPPSVIAQAVSLNIPNYTPEINQLKSQITGLDNRIGQQEQVNQQGTAILTDLQPKIDKISTGLDNIIPTLAGIPLIPALIKDIPNQVPNKGDIATATGGAICNSFNGGCAGNALKQTENNILGGTGNQMNNLLNGLNTGANAAQLGLLNVINNKLGAQVAGGISGFMGTINTGLTSFYNWSLVQQAINILTLAATVHNAFQLSSNVLLTLETIIDQVVALIVPKDKDHQPVPIAQSLGAAVHELLSNFIPDQQLNSITAEWAQANRIYQAASNVYNQVSNAVGILSSGLELIGGNVAKIGNALKIWGVIGQKAYSFMNPQPNLKGKFFDFINNANTEAQTIMQVVAVPVAMAAAATAINDSTNQLAQALIQIPPTNPDGSPKTDGSGTVLPYQPGMAVPDPQVTTIAFLQGFADSVNAPIPSDTDLLNANE